MISTSQTAGICSVLAPFQFTQGSNLGFYRDTQTVFCSLLRQRWEALIGEGLPASPEAESIRELAVGFTGSDLEHYLLQPEVSHRLLLGGAYASPGGEDFFRRTLSAHLARKTHAYDRSRYNCLWSANGDYLIAFNPDNGTFDAFEAPQIGDVMPVDFFSPYCQGLSQEAIHEKPDTRFELYTMEEAEDVFGHMEASVQPLAGNRNFYELICRFNKVVMVKKQHNQDGRRPFISGSDGYFIGRTHVMNPEVVPQEPLAEMFVHEAIHTILYMLEENRPWMPTMNDALRIGITVPSNWSGNQLSIRSYFQAIFVWFGIWNLWRYARANKLYDQGWVEKRMAYVVNGFASLDPDRIKAAYGIALPEETVDAVMEAKRIVLKG